MSQLAENDSGTTALAVLRPSPPPPRRGFSVALKLTLFVGLTLSVLLAGLLAGSGFYWRNVLRKQVDAQLSAVAASRRDMVHAQLDLLLQRMTVNTDRGEFRGFLQEVSKGQPDPAGEAWSQASLLYVADGKPVVSASLTDAKGLIILSSDPADVGRVITTTSEFQAGLHEAHVGWPRPVESRFQATLTAPVRPRSEPHKVVGVLLATVDVSALAAALRDVTGLGATGEALLGVRQGDQFRFLFPPRHAPALVTVPLAVAPPLGATAEGQAAFSKARDYRGVAVLEASEPIDYRGWTLVVKMDEAEAYAPVDRALRLMGLAGLAVIALGLAGASILALRFTRPVRRLAEAATRVANGDYAAQVPVQSSDELGALSVSFNKMTAAIRARGDERDAAERALRTSETNARDAEAALREADRRKDEFLAMLGHELRNPLSAIANAARLWREVEHDDAETAALARDIVERQTAHLSRLVDDLLDVARITEGKILLRRRPVEAAGAVRRAAEALRPLFEERRHQLILQLPEGEPLRLHADPTRLEQIVANLLTNAAKYTPDGGHITVTARREDHEAVVDVTDNGIGIAPELLAHIFELFTQADHSLDRPVGGLGLGLNLSRQLVELHGGTLSAHSAGPGRGATFTMRLPTVDEDEPSAALVPRPLSPAPHRHRVLLVDDNVDTARSLSRLLTRRGHEVATAYDGLVAIRIAHEFRPDVLLLDLGLPGLDGYALARRLRADGFATAPMIAISGYAQEADRARAQEAGFNRHFAKPVDFESLAALLAAASSDMLADP